MILFFCSNLTRHVAELSQEVARLQTELNSARLQEFEAQEQAALLSAQLDEERALRNNGTIFFTLFGSKENRNSQKYENSVKNYAMILIHESLLFRNTQMEIEIIHKLEKKKLNISSKLDLKLSCHFSRWIRHRESERYWAFFDLPEEFRSRTPRIQNSEIIALSYLFNRSLISKRIDEKFRRMYFGNLYNLKKEI